MKPYSRTVVIRDEGLEVEADRLLNSMDRGGEFPAYTEFQLSRHGHRNRCAYITPEMEAVLEDPRIPQPMIDEIRFLASLSSLTAAERFCLNAWLMGMSQAETMEESRARGKTICQQSVSRYLARAQRKCLDSTELSFAAFSRKRIYRKPLRSNHSWRTGKCRRCGEIFVSYLGAGCYCSTGCRDSAQSSR